MRFPRVMVTGHRTWQPGVDTASIREELSRVAYKLRREYGAEVALSGMAMGVDTWWAATALHEEMDLWAYIPFLGQADLWRPIDRRRYERLMAEASRVVVAGEGRSVRLYHARNDAMLRDSDLVVAVRDPAVQVGGTVSVIRKAQRQRKPIITVRPDGPTTIRLALADLDGPRTSVRESGRSLARR